jgi:hypothetical protein
MPSVFLRLAVPLLLLLSACGQRINDPVSFELYAGNPALPPPNQGLSVIQGMVQPTAVLLTYRTADGEQEESGELALQGADREECVALLKRTRLRPAKENGEVLELTLTDASGEQLTGTPTNGDEWAAFAKGIAQRRAQASLPTY